MTKVQVPFSALPVGARFSLPGWQIDLMKASSKTARIGGNGSTIWVSKRDLVLCDEYELKEES